MKNSFSFCIDNKLRIHSWGEEIAEFTGKNPDYVLGKKYYEVLPKIYVERKDALLTVLKENKPLILKGYSFGCLRNQIKADIKITPIKSGDSHNNKVKVDICRYSTCSLDKKLQNSQRLIDIGRISSVFAHGLRNPLNAIGGAVVYLREKYKNEPTLIEFTKIMEDEILRLDCFISKFLSTSLTESVSSETDINSLLRKIEVFTSLQAHANNITSVFEYGNVPSVIINPFQLEQAILNVINNAIQAMPSGGQFRVKIYSNKISDNNFVIIEISDTGPGMAKNREDDIPAPFKKTGKGFGLFLTREILQYYGGSMEIRSKKGSGTTVRLLIPAHIRKNNSKK